MGAVCPRCSGDEPNSVFLLGAQTVVQLKVGSSMFDLLSLGTCIPANARARCYCQLYRLHRSCCGCIVYKVFGG